MSFKNKITTSKNVLCFLYKNEDEISEELQYLVDNFCGEVVKDLDEIDESFFEKRIYVCGDVGKFSHDNHPIFVIKEFSYNYENRQEDSSQFVELGEVPVLIHHVGVYFRCLFKGDDYFNKIKTAHEFQNLTESNKPGKALRKGIYLTDVRKEETADEKEILHFRLLRCSSNLTGPTDNFRKTDREVIHTLNDAAKYVFEKEAKLNHVLAQIYHNKKTTTGTKIKETKAKIKAHSDKTKDMSKEGLIAFCTFYDEANFKNLKSSNSDRYDWCYKNISGLTRLRFKLKKSVTDDTLEREFSVTLYPNSVFIIPLSTNRLYTHEIRPSMLNIEKIPTRMGYVVRCSKAEAMFMDNQTYLKENGTLTKLENIDQKSMLDLRSTYYEENSTGNVVQYGQVHFSMNLGDYQQPIL